MGKDDELKRDNLRDIITPELPEEFLEEMRTSKWTHVFHFKDKSGHFHEVNYEKQGFYTRTDLPKFILKEYKLFQTDFPATNEWIAWKNNYDYYLNKIFSPIFQERIKHIDYLKIDKYRLILPEEKFNQINQFIEQYALQFHKDFVFYLIAKIEEIYVHDVEFYERPEQQKQIKNFPKEIEKLVNVLKWSESDYSNDSLPKPELKDVTFHYDREPLSVKITDHLLLMSITKGTIENFSNGRQKNWEKQLRSFPSVISENQLPNAFRHRICKALHNFFREVKAFDFGNKKTTEREIEAIAKILDFAHVKFFNKKGIEYDIETDLYEIKQNVKNAIKRKELVYHPIQYSIKDLVPDFNTLKKYFSSDFLIYGSNVYSQQEVIEVVAITDRFEVNELLPQLIYLFSCLKEKLWQFDGNLDLVRDKEKVEGNKDYQSWKKIIEMLTSKKNFCEVNFKILGESETYSFKERLSFELLEQAIKEYYENNPFEFKIDFYESNIEPGLTPKSFKKNPTGNLHNPKNRFFSLFCKQCYDFLLHESPPKKNESKPSERYYGIIGLLLLKAYYLGHQMWDEEFVFKKIKYWHEL